MGVNDITLTEIDRRKNMWLALQKSADASGDVTPAAIRELGVYSGQAGIYRDVRVTRSVIAPEGIAISFRHNHSSYDDDLTEDGLVYHYPATERTPGFDTAEIESAKTAFRLGMPIFVITGRKAAKLRRVRLGYVEQVIDAVASLLITFTDEILPAVSNNIEDPFDLTAPVAQQTLQKVRKRPNQSRFALNVKARYGASCAVCRFAAPAGVTAAHLLPKKFKGSDDARNGLPLCANHHITLDRGLWRIDPESGSVVATEGVSLFDLQISRKNLEHLPAQPHESAIHWLWKHGFNPV